MEIGQVLWVSYHEIRPSSQLTVSGLPCCVGVLMCVRVRRSAFVLPGINSVFCVLPLYYQYYNMGGTTGENLPGTNYL